MFLPTRKSSSRRKMIVDDLQGGVGRSDSVVVLESSPNSPVEGRDAKLLGTLRRAAEQELVRKLDMRLVPTLVVIFIMNYIDVRWFI
jgi:hypothetical protein